MKRYLMTSSNRRCAECGMLFHLVQSTFVMKSTIISIIISIGCCLNLRVATSFTLCTKALRFRRQHGKVLLSYSPSAIPPFEQMNFSNISRRGNYCLYSKRSRDIDWKSNDNVSGENHEDASYHHFVNKRKTRRVKPTSNTRERSIANQDPLLSLNINLDYLAKSGQKNSAARAEELLMRIEQLHKEGYYDVKPDRVSYNSVMNAYVLSEDVINSEKEVQRLMERMEGKGDDLLKPNIISFNTLISSLGKNGQIQKAEEILSRMETYYKQGINELAPNTISYNTLIDAYAKAGNPIKAEEVLRRMMAVSLSREDVKADTIAFNSVLQAWSTSGRKNAAARAEQLLKHMSKLYHAGNHDVKPDCISFSTVISTWASSNQTNAAERAFDILHEMESQCALGDRNVCPTIVTYTAVINALARTEMDNAAERALSILLKVKDLYRRGFSPQLKPDFICYTSVIDAFAKSKLEHAAERAVELLNEMINLYEEGDEGMKPNTKTYCSVITALGRSKMYGAADIAQKLLDDCERMYAFGNDDVAPNTILFNSCIDAWAKSSFIFKAQRAESLLTRMEEEFLAGNVMYKPDIITYNSVINACANSFGDDPKLKKQTFLIALKAFKKVLESSDIQQTSRTYFLYLKAVRKLMTPGSDRDLIVKKVFEYCRKDGALNDFVWGQIELSCGKNVLEEIRREWGM